MQQPEGALQDFPEDILSRLAPWSVVSVQAQLGQFHVPVTELIPDKLVQQPAGPTQIVAVDKLYYPVSHRAEPTSDPAVGQGKL